MLLSGLQIIYDLDYFSNNTLYIKGNIYPNPWSNQDHTFHLFFMFLYPAFIIQ